MSATATEMRAGRTATKRSAVTSPRRRTSARSARKACRRGSRAVNSSLECSWGRSDGQVQRPGNDSIAEALDIERSLDRSADQHVAPVVFVAMAGDKLQSAHRVQRTGNDGLGDAEPGSKSAHGMRRRREIDGKQNGHLPHGQVRRVVAYL